MKMNFIKVTQIIAVSIAYCSISFGQVGVNTPNPNSSAALEVVSPSASDNRGVLLPRMTTAQMATIATNATTIGLMVFNTDEKSFYYHDGTDWIALVPKQPLTTNSNVPQKIGNIVIDSGAVITQNATVNGDLNVNGFSQNALVPTGAIMMWSGYSDTIPKGWGLCNGNYYSTGGPIYGTPPPAPGFALPGFLQSPDLRGRFIVGEGQNSNPAPGDMNPTYILNQEGGTNQTILTKDQLPKHQHIITNGVDGAIQSNPGNHTHDTESYDTRQQNNDGAGPRNDLARPGGSRTSTGAGAHTHSGVTGDGTSDGLNANPIDNRPAFYALAFIIKLP
jgi:microcystin-dependent protein